MNKKILCVDDNRTILALYAKFFKEFDLELAFSGNDAIRIIKESIENGYPFAVAFIDVVMPDKNGLDVIREIREIDKCIEIAVVTGDDTVTFREIHRELDGLDKFLFFQKRTQSFWRYELTQVCRYMVRAWNQTDLLQNTMCDYYELVRIINSGMKAQNEIWTN